MTKGLMPGAIHKIIPPGSNDPAILPCGVTFHIAVSKSDSLYDYFAHKSGGIESHFYVRSNGIIEQYRNIFREADAQSDGNSFYRNGQRFGFISVESEGMGAGKWTYAQLESFKRIVDYVKSERNFPLRQAPAWNRGGLGYHCLFREWNPNNHSCPGEQRIKQFHNYLVPWCYFKPVHRTNFRLAHRSDDALAVKKALRAKGYKGFIISGPGKRTWGRGSIRAYARFEADHKLFSNGKPDSRSLHILKFRLI